MIDIPVTEWSVITEKTILCDLASWREMFFYLRFSRRPSVDGLLRMTVDVTETF